MKRHARTATVLALAAALGALPVVPAAATPSGLPETAPAAAPETQLALAAPAAAPLALAELEQAQDASGYNSEYIFALTRGLADSSMHPAGKVPLFIFTLPLDVVFLPFAAIAGLFG